MNWVPEKACKAVTESVKELGKFNFSDLDCGLVESDVKSFVEELAPEVFPKLKESIQASAIDRSDDANLVSAACARAPVAYAITAVISLCRLVDELSTIYKEAAMKKAREEIRMHVSKILRLLRLCKGLQFEAAWEKHKDDPNLATLELLESSVAIAN